MYAAYKIIYNLKYCKDFLTFFWVATETKDIQIKTSDLQVNMGFKM